MRVLQGCVMGMSEEFAGFYYLKSVAQDRLVLVEFSQVKKYKRRSVSLLTLLHTLGKTQYLNQKHLFFLFFF